jgi:hypothetical protein
MVSSEMAMGQSSEETVWTINRAGQDKRIASLILNINHSQAF